MLAMNALFNYNKDSQIHAGRLKISIENSILEKLRAIVGRRVS